MQPELVNRMGVAAQRIAHESYNEDQMIDRLAALYWGPAR